MKTNKDIVFRAVGRNISYYRKMLRLTQRDLAGKAHVSPSSVGRLERGCYNENVPLSMVIDLADAMDIDFTKFFQFNREDMLRWRQ